MSEYLVRFTAVNPGPVDEGAAGRLADAIHAMPGVDPAGGAALEAGGQAVTGVLAIKVDQAMADAARDGSRMAKEALKAAGLDDAKLVDLHISLPAEGGPELTP